MFNALAGDDVMDASALGATVVRLNVDAGADDDVLLGGPGVDSLNGGAGSNIVIQD